MWRTLGISEWMLSEETLSPIRLLLTLPEIKENLNIFKKNFIIG
jgi:hypothetical protein